MAGNGNGEVMTMPVVVSQCNPPWGLYVILAIHSDGWISMRLSLCSVSVVGGSLSCLGFTG